MFLVAALQVPSFFWSQQSLSNVTNWIFTKLSLVQMRLRMVKIWVTQTGNSPRNNESTTELVLPMQISITNACHYTVRTVKMEPQLKCYQDAMVLIHLPSTVCKTVQLGFKTSINSPEPTHLKNHLYLTESAWLGLEALLSPIAPISPLEKFGGGLCAIGGQGCKKMGNIKATSLLSHTYMRSHPHSSTASHSLVVPS